MKRLPFAAALLAAALLLAPTAATAGTDAGWAIDASHSHVGFKVRHNTVSWVKGRFAEVDGTVTWDGASPKSVEATITIAIASVDTENEKRDKHLRSADFFDAEQFPTATFTSTKIGKVKDDGAFQLVGTLEMHGVSKEVTLDVDPISGPVQDPWGNTRIGTSATVTINRQDWGVSWSKLLDAGGLVVGDEVHLTLEVELTKKK